MFTCEGNFIKCTFVKVKRVYYCLLVRSGSVNIYKRKFHEVEPFAGRKFYMMNDEFLIKIFNIFKSIKFLF